ncbi:MAG: hypothetical protein B7X00_01150, partial [Legionella sp. 21-45-4]
MRRQTLQIGLLSLLFAFHLTFATCAFAWKPTAAGINYLDLHYSPLTPWSHVHVFKIHLEKNKFDLIHAAELKKTFATTPEFAELSHALITLNSGFFDLSYHPLGLRIGHKHQYTAAKPISWWGVFYILDKKAYVSRFSQIKSPQRIDFAVQSGPRLIVNGTIPHLKPGFAERSALGITQSGQVIILITENTPMSTTQLAELMRAPPLNCEQA